MSAACRPVPYILLEHALGRRCVLMVPLVDQRDQSGRAPPAVTGDRGNRRLARSFSSRSSSPITQLLAALALPDVRRHRLEVVGQRRASAVSTAGVVGRQCVVALDEAAPPRRRAVPASPRARRATARGVDHERRQVRLGEVAVVVRLFLAAHRDGAARRRRRTAASPAPRGRPVSTTSICRAISYSIAFCRKRNELRFLTSALVPSVVCALRAHRHVGVAAQAALFHVAVVDAEPDEDARAAVSKKCGGLGRRAQVRLGDDLDERHAGAVEVDVGLAIGVGKALVQRLAGVLFHVDARDARCARGPSAPSNVDARRRSRAAARTARSGSPSAGPDRSSSCARRPTSR